MSNLQSAGLILFLSIAAAALFFLWKIFSITFPHWKWREDHFGRQIKGKLTREEWSKVKKYRLYFFLSIVAGLIVFILLSLL
ncbi:MAG: hypothetical protein HOP10_01510 [Chitinophagaceae bacterium]|nr:hypothetical protein [Chitinophagaceae bacterium]